MYVCSSQFLGLLSDVLPSGRGRLRRPLPEGVGMCHQVVPWVLVDSSLSSFLFRCDRHLFLSCASHWLAGPPSAALCLGVYALSCGTPLPGPCLQSTVVHSRVLFILVQVGQSSVPQVGHAIFVAICYPSAAGPPSAAPRASASCRLYATFLCFSLEGNPTPSFEHLS